MAYPLAQRPRCGHLGMTCDIAWNLEEAEMWLLSMWGADAKVHEVDEEPTSTEPSAAGGAAAGAAWPLDEGPAAGGGGAACGAGAMGGGAYAAWGAYCGGPACGGAGCVHSKPCTSGPLLSPAWGCLHGAHAVQEGHLQ